MSSTWQVVAQNGSILVREALELNSSLSGRLSSGARVEEVQLVSTRLHYKKISGSGPSQGWITVKTKDRVLAQRLCGFHLMCNPGPTLDSEQSKRSWRNPVLSDWTIRLGNRTYQVHRADLCEGERGSQFFLTLFQRWTGERSTTDLTSLIPEVCWPVFENVLDFLYDGHIHHSMDNAVLLFKIAHVLEMPMVCNILAGFLKENLSIQNVFPFLRQCLQIGAGFDSFVEEATTVIARGFRKLRGKPLELIAQLPVEVSLQVLAKACAELESKRLMVWKQATKITLIAVSVLRSATSGGATASTVLLADARLSKLSLFIKRVTPEIALFCFKIFTTLRNAKQERRALDQAVASANLSFFQEMAARARKAKERGVLASVEEAQAEASVTMESPAESPSMSDVMPELERIVPESAAGTVAAEPVAEDAAVDDTQAEEATAEEPVAEEPVAEEPVAEEATAEEPEADTNAEPTAEDAAAEDAPAENAATAEDATVEEAAADAAPAEEEEKERAAKCPSGHCLQVFVTEFDGFVCNGCRKIINTAERLLSCRSCNYDLCQLCVQERQCQEEAVPQCPQIDFEEIQLLNFERRCWEEAVAQFPKINFEDLHLLNFDEVFKLLDTDELGTESEDVVFEAIRKYIEAAEGLSDTQISALWSTCRFTHLSLDMLCKEALFVDLIPQKDLKLALAARARLKEEGEASMDEWLATCDCEKRRFARRKANRKRSRSADRFVLVGSINDWSAEAGYVLPCSITLGVDASPDPEFQILEDGNWKKRICPARGDEMLYPGKTGLAIQDNDGFFHGINWVVSRRTETTFRIEYDHKKQVIKCL
mmetsp:Transcript_46640/g.85664  ORF Transcript_46640/g.85664 Transcript_46640/m.85664 type:complete len:827 (-) Transcript_46640:46-2526(-)